MDEAWKNDPVLNGMNSQKLQFLTDLVKEVEKSPKDALLPIILSANAKASAKGMNFNDQETDLLLNVLAPKMSKGDRNKIDTMKKFATMMSKKNSK